MQATPALLSPRRLMAPLFATALVLSPLALGTAHADSFNFKLFGFANRSTTEMDTPTGHISLKLIGKVEFNDAEDDVRSTDGKASLEERRNGHTTRIEFSSDAEHRVVRNYSVDGRVQALDAEGKRWLATIIPAMIRETTHDAARRVRRIFDKGGPDAVLAEIDRIDSSFARRIYIVELNGMGALSEQRVQHLLASTSAMHSDFELRNALVAIAEHQNLSSASQVAYLNGCAKLDSDFERRNALNAVAPRLTGGDAVANAWQTAMSKMESDFEARNAIDVMVRHSNASQSMIEAALQATLKMRSDFEHRTALISISNTLRTPTPAQTAIYLKSAAGISSSFERRNTLVALIERNGLDKSASLGVLDAASGMDSDFELCNVLLALAKRMPNDAEVIARYRKMARGLSDFSRGQVEKALDHLG